MMINPNSYRTRFYLLIAVVPLLVLLSWKLAFAQTVKTHGELKQLRSSIDQYTNPDQTISLLKKKLSGIQDTDILDPSEVDENLMDAISRNIDHFNISLEEFPETHSFRSDHYLIQTFKLTFSGRFIDLLKFIHYAEYEIRSCRIVSVGFNRKELRRTGEKLFVDIYFQSVYRN